MRIANVGGRAKLEVAGGEVADVATLSGGEFGPGLGALYDDWERFRSWAAALDKDKVSAIQPFSPSLAGPPRPSPGRCSPWPSTTPSTPPSPATGPRRNR